MLRRILCALAALLLWTAPGCAEGFRESDYALEGPFIVDVWPLDAENVAASCWEHETGDADEPLYLTWWRQGTIYRQIRYTWTENNRDLVPIDGDTCRVLTLEADGETGYRPAPTRATLYDWTAAGMENSRVLAEGVISRRINRNAIALLRRAEGKTWLCLYDGGGAPEAELEMAEGIDNVISAARDDGGLWAVTVAARPINNNFHPMVIRDGQILWEGDTGGLVHAAQMDGAGGYFVVERLSGSQYAPLTITRYDDHGGRLRRWELSGKNVVLSAQSRMDPATGNLVILGMATANSRNFRCVYRLEADEKGRILSLDTRACPGGEEIRGNLYLSPDCREARVLLRRLDGTPASWVPFEALPAGENPDIRLK